MGTSATIEEVKKAHEDRLLALDGVVGVGIQTGEIGDPVIIVYLRDAGVANKIPENLEGYPVISTVTGEIDAY